MLSKRMINLVGQRLTLMKWGLVSYFDWDKSTEKVVEPNIYILFNMLFGGVVVVMFPLSHIIQMYLQLLYREKDDTGKNIPFTMTQFTTLVIAWGEISLGLSFFGLNRCFLMNWKKIISAFNRSFAYNQRIMDVLKAREIDLDHKHLKIIRQSENLAFIFNIFSFGLPFGLSLVVLHPIEPTHVIIRDWLEIEITLHPAFLPWIFLFSVGIMGAANLIAVIGHLVLCNYLLTTVILDDLTPTEIHRREGLQLTLNTQYYGAMEDTEIVQIYREIRILNVLLNEIVATFWFSIHHVGCLGTASTLIFFSVKGQSIILENGIIGVLVVGGSLISPMMVVWFQSSLFGHLQECSNQFREAGKNMLPRRMFYRKFENSCQTFYIDETYPFYKIGKDTFPAFWAQVVDYAVTLLLWRR